jgi:DNA-directed RNA polymerase alpha subunit
MKMISSLNNVEKVTGIKIEKLELSVRTRNCLEKKKIDTIYELLLNSESELLKIDGFGVKALKETKSALTDIGIALLPLSVVNFSKRELSSMGQMIDVYMDSLTQSYKGSGDCSGGG